MAMNGGYRYRAQTRSVITRYTLTFGITMLLLSVTEVSLMGRWRPLGAVPDMMLCLVISAGMFCGQYAGAVIGIIAGFLIDAIGSGGISLMPVFYLIVGYTVGCLIRSESQRNIAAYAFCFGCGAVGRAGITMICTILTYREMRIGEMILHTVLPEMAVTLIAGAVLYFPMKWVCRLPEGKKKGS